MDAGDTHIAPEWSDVTLRGLRRTTDYVRLFWRARGTMSDELEASGRIGIVASTHTTARRLAEALVSSDPASARAAAFDVIDGLRSSGVPFIGEACDPRRHEVPAAAHAMARALERVLTPFSGQPMAIDLARQLGVGEAQALRRVADHFGRYHVTVGAWREYVRGMRMALAAFFASVRGARTEHVSRLLGFSSPTSLCHAFLKAGLPSPMELQRELSRS
jgi:AraC-like DNA-binding protein